MREPYYDSEFVVIDDLASEILMALALAGCTLAETEAVVAHLPELASAVS